MNLRDYQSRCVDATYTHACKSSGHGLIVVPTGGGKSVIIAETCRKALVEWGVKRVLVLSHVKELIAQNTERMLQYWPKAPVGVYSASLGKKEMHKPITVATIQSVYNKQIPVPDIVLIDEAHLLSRNASGMYLKLLTRLWQSNPGIKIYGYSATPYRMDSGPLTEGAGAVFDSVIAEITIGELLELGFLCRLVSKVSQIQASLKSVRITAGEFNAHDMEKAFGGEFLDEAIPDLLALAIGRKHGIIFCPTVKFAENVASRLRTIGETSMAISSETPKKERDLGLAAFKEGKYRWLCSVNLVTTGFDAPIIDVIALWRATVSSGLYYQIVGRGLRIHPNKENCIVEGQRILTDSGLVPIEKITISMKIWDGIDFVQHCGIQLRGKQKVIKYAGLIATPDHKVWTQEGWKTFGECASKQIPIQITGDGGLPVKYTEGKFRDCPPIGEQRKASFVSTSYLQKLRERGIKVFRQFKEEDRRMPQVWENNQYLKASVGCAALAFDAVYRGEAAVYESAEQPIQRLRRKRDKVQFQKPQRNGEILDGQFFFRQESSDRQNKQRWRLRSWQYPFCEAKDKYEQSASKPRNSTNAPIQGKVSRGAICRRNLKKIFFRKNDIRGSNRKILLSAFGQTEGRVWDILNCGPRNRFTCEGLLVSNCLVLDYGGNIERHGPITKITPPIKKGNGEKREFVAKVKICPVCRSPNELDALECEICATELVIERDYTKNLTGVAADIDIMGGDALDALWVDVDSVKYAVHKKLDKPDSLRVEYTCGLLVYKEWVHFNSNKATMKRRAAAWWRKDGWMAATPIDTEQAWLLSGNLRCPKSIYVQRNGKYWEVKDYEFRPVSQERHDLSDGRSIAYSQGAASA